MLDQMEEEGYARKRQAVYEPPAVPLTTQGIHPHPGPKMSRKGVNKKIVKLKIPKRIKKSSYARTGQPQAKDNFSVVQSVARAYGSTFQQDKTFAKRYRFKHCEFIGNVNGSVNYANQYQLSVNPGIPDFLPFLANLANMFESYEFRSLRFEFRNSSGTNTPGLVMMAIDYDALDEVTPILTTEQEFMDYSGAVSAPVWMPLTFNFDRKYDRQVGWGGPRTVRNTSAPTNSDLRLFDVGQFYLATSGMTQDNIGVGKLYISYTVDFLKPRLSPMVSLTGATISAGLTVGTPFGAARSLTPSTSYKSSNMMPDVFNGTVGGVAGVSQFYELRPGTYHISFQIVGTNLVPNTPTNVWLSAVNAANGTTLVSNSPVITNATQTTVATYGAIYVVTRPVSSGPFGIGAISNGSGSITIAPLSLISTITASDYMINQVNVDTAWTNGAFLTKKQFEDIVSKLSLKIKDVEELVEEEKEERDSLLTARSAIVKPINNWDTVSTKSLGRK